MSNIERMFASREGLRYTEEMTPPRDLDAGSGGELPPADSYLGLCEEIAQVQGVVNAAEDRLVELVRQGIAAGISGGTNLTDVAWVAWRAGVSPERAGAIVALARRADELPCTMRALSSGELTVDQAAVVARHVPVRFEASAAQVAPFCTVAQLRQALPHYRDPKPTAERHTQGRLASRFDESGYHLYLHVPDVAQGAVVEQALRAMREDLRRQARAAAADGAPVEPVSAVDAMVALAETALLAGEAARPGTDRYLVHVHLEAGPQGLELMTHLGIPIPESERRHLLCDAKLRGLVHDQAGAPLGTGRAVRAINRRMRRAVEHRDGHCCRVPGCHRTTGLEIHHIRHWEDGGPTETWNLITLCEFHHRCHHRGTLGIEGNADLVGHLAPGIVFTDGWGHPLDAVGRPILLPRREPGDDPADHLIGAAVEVGLDPHRYEPPTGERLDRWGFHLQEVPEADPAEQDPPPAVIAAPEPCSRHRPGAAPPNLGSPATACAADLTRAGPAGC